jgi:hypothetical protein
MELVETFVLSWTELLEACGIPSRRAILINLKKKKKKHFLANWDITENIYS